MSEKYLLPAGFRVISGGQTGADAAGLDFAIENGITHGGWCTKGRRCDDGLMPARFNLAETPLRGYLQRTEWNVRDADATVIFTLDEKLDGGSLRAAKFADDLGRPWIHVRPRVDLKFLARFLARRRITKLNVAGKRESEAPGIYKYVYDSLSVALTLPFVDHKWPR